MLRHALDIHPILAKKKQTKNDTHNSSICTFLETYLFAPVLYYRRLFTIVDASCIMHIMELIRSTILLKHVYALIVKRKCKLRLNKSPEMHNWQFMFALFRT